VIHWGGKPIFAMLPGTNNDGPVLVSDWIVRREGESER